MNVFPSVFAAFLNIFELFSAICETVCYKEVFFYVGTGLLVQVLNN